MTEGPVVLYDGVCGFCDRAVQTLLRLDRRGVLRFAALESGFAAAVLERHPELGGVDSVVLVEDAGLATERVTVRSDAVLRVVALLGWPWRALGVARVVPRVVRDRLYDAFAAIRYRVFGRLDTCPLPAPEVRARFLDVAPT